MLEQISPQPINYPSQIFEAKASRPDTLHSHSLSRIITVSFDENKRQRLPISRHSLKISVIGLSTMGSAAAIGWAALGHKVIAVDHDLDKINALNKGITSINDAKLKSLLKQVSNMKNLVASEDLHHAILNTDVSILCLGNNCSPKATVTNSDDMTSIIKQMSNILSSKRHFHLFAIAQPTYDTETKNFIGTQIERLTGKTLGKDFGLCFMPLVLREDDPLSDFYSLPNMNVTASDNSTQSLITKLFDGFNHKIKYTKYIKM